MIKRLFCISLIYKGLFDENSIFFGFYKYSYNSSSLYLLKYEKIYLDTIKCTWSILFINHVWKIPFSVSRKCSDVLNMRPKGIPLAFSRNGHIFNISTFLDRFQFNVASDYFYKFRMSSSIYLNYYSTEVQWINYTIMNDKIIRTSNILELIIYTFIGRSRLNVTSDYFAIFRMNSCIY
jgi:hypothetical protein